MSSSVSKTRCHSRNIVRETRRYNMSVPAFLKELLPVTDSPVHEECKYNLFMSRRDSQVTQILLAAVVVWI